MSSSQQCPFRPGDLVVYRPTEHGWGWGEVMQPLDERLVPGKEYVVVEVQRDAFVVVKGYKHPGGGLYWTEFQPKKS